MISNVGWTAVAVVFVGATNRASGVWALAIVTPPSEKHSSQGAKSKSESDNQLHNTSILNGRKKTSTKTSKDKLKQNA